MHDTVNGFPIIAMFATTERGCDRSGRILIADRGDTHDERYVVSWQGYNAEKRRWDGWWDSGCYCRVLGEAVVEFAKRCKREVERA